MSGQEGTPNGVDRLAPDHELGTCGLTDCPECATRAAISALRESRNRLKEHERRANKERVWRDALCLELAEAGMTTREIGALAGISSPAVTFACRRARSALARLDSGGGANG